MTKPFINDEQLQNAQLLINTQEKVNIELAFTTLQNFRFPPALLKKIHTQHPLECHQYQNCIPKHRVKSVVMVVQENTLSEDFIHYQNPILEKMTILGKVDIGFRRLDHIWHLTSIKELVLLDHPWLGTFLPDLEALIHLKSITIKNSGIRTQNFLPETIVNLPQLEVLDFQNCGIELIHSVVGQIKTLKILRLRGCQNLWFLPHTLRELPQLKLLDIRGTGIKNRQKIHYLRRHLPDTQVLTDKE